MCVQIYGRCGDACPSEKFMQSFDLNGENRNKASVAKATMEWRRRKYHEEIKYYCAVVHP